MHTPDHPPPAFAHAVAAVVLAAGESSRLGAFKPLLPWPAEDSTEPLVRYQVRELLAAGVAPVLVVTGNRAAEVAPLARAAGATVVHNPHFREGKAASVRAGVEATPDGAALLIVGVDQPRPAWLFRNVIEAAHSGAQLVIPTHAGRRGHPPLFAAGLRTELLSVREETFGLRAIIQQHASAIYHLEIGGPLVLVNLNTPDDLAVARRLFAARAMP